MQFLTNLFGSEGVTLASMLLALGFVLVLMLLVLWGLKMMFRTSGTIGRGRARRLTLVDSLVLDPKRQLLIIRRDNVEHLVLTGGPQDLVIETGIAVETSPVRVPVRRPQPATSPKLPQPRPAASSAPAQPSRAGKDTPVTTPSNDVRPASVDLLPDETRPASDRRNPSLRHTGLLRAVSRPEPGVVTRFPENSTTAPSDSAKEGWSELSGKGNGGDGKSGASRAGGRTADRQ